MPGTVEQREQAKRELRMKNHKDIFELPEELRIAGKPVRIFNVGAHRHQRSMGSYGQWTIHACDPGFVWVREENEKKEGVYVKKEAKEGEISYSQPTEVPYITNDPVHIDMFQMAHRHDSGRKLALDILGVGQFHTPAENLEVWGVFVAADELPTHKELKEALRKLNRTYDHLVEEADAYWNQGPTEYRNVTDMHRMAAKMRGQMGKPWARGVIEMVTCPICASQINPDAAICPNCKTVRDEQKVVEARVPGYEHLWDVKKKENRL